MADVVRPEVRLRREPLAMPGRDEAEFEAYVISDGGRLLGFALLRCLPEQRAEALLSTD